MATAAKIVIDSFRLGSGEYIQESGAAKKIGAQIKRIKCTHPFVITGATAWSLAGESLSGGMKAEGIDWELYIHKGYCEPELGEALTLKEPFISCDCVVGVGGGHVLDMAKLMAFHAKLPVITVPTSSATCAAYTPLSVMYSAEGKNLGTRHHQGEVSCVIADMDILSRQPVRLLTAGIYDSLAKVPEICQRLIGKEPDMIDVGLASSYALSQYMYDVLLSNLDKACEDTARGESSKTVYDTVYMCIALTGVISGLARGSNQTAIAHKVYEASRSRFSEKAKDMLHGELVALGLIVQLYYNGDSDGAERFSADMQKYGMKTRLSQIGITEADAVDTYFDYIMASSAMAGTTAKEHERLKEALEKIA